MHRPTTAARTSGRATEEFSHEFPRRHTLSQRMSVAAMRAEDRIGFRQVRTNSRRNRFLPDIRMTGTVNESPLMTACELLLRVPDDEHCAIEGNNLIIGHACIVLNQQRAAGR